MGYLKADFWREQAGTAAGLRAHGFLQLGWGMGSSSGPAGRDCTETWGAQGSVGT